MEMLKTIAFVVFAIGFGTWVFGRKWLETEIKRNNAIEPPSEQQLRWHIRHLREDMHTLVLINYTLLMAVVAALFLKD